MVYTPTVEAETGGSLEGPKLKANRAKKHLSDLQAAIDRFFETNPYFVVVKDNPESGYRECEVARADPLPPDLAIISGDCIHNLRSALDHLVWQLVLANGRKPEEMRTAFPVWRSEADFESGRPGDAKGISKEALNVLYGLKPYKGGNDALWRVHKLDIVDKHRLVLALASGHQEVIIDLGAYAREWTMRQDPERFRDLEFPSAFLPVPPDERVVIEPGAVLFQAPLGDKSHDNVKFAFEVALYEPGFPAGESLVKTLHEMVGFVDEVIDLFAPFLRAPNA